jgi:CxxC motif-containing protein (DUF1111 family)
MSVLGRIATAVLLLGPASLMPQLSLAGSPGLSDPGVRGGPPGAGGPCDGLTAAELEFFADGQVRFREVDSVSGTEPGAAGRGLGPRFNLNSCAGCHAQPAAGGSSPALNPQIVLATQYGARNTVPAFLRSDGPVREVRFRLRADGSRDGGVHPLFVITGRADAGSCSIAQPDFSVASNLAFRIPTPLFGAGLIEAISDSTILANRNAYAEAKRALGIAGHENRSANDGTITRYGWKAQNKSLAVFSAEAYNVEQGATNELFPNETDETPGCVMNSLPEDRTYYQASSTGLASISDATAFAAFARFLAPPQPAWMPVAAQNGAAVFSAIGCALCHTPALATGSSSSPALASRSADLYSDLLVHHMGTTLADGIVQGTAQGDEFRTAPLWGLGQRIFFLHDGRTDDLVSAIEAHASPGSEANAVINNFRGLTPRQKRNLLSFLRAL